MRVSPITTRVKAAGTCYWDQDLITYVKRQGRLVKVDSLPVRFVPMTGKALRKWN